ncbi:TPA: hypothetical protein DCZ90_02105 [Candidatus Amesbacteria bacterium]|nr:MAG: Sodium/hydrogen exchanger [Candidatus Amesbacteria bacterium GW2011_GWC1_46_24]HBC72589.1 hypothetical protein [Candidatus Amesbacteria bacterium]
MTETFGGMAAILVLAALGGVAAKLLKQPVMLGYLVVGLGISVVWSGITGHPQSIKAMVDLMGQVGVTLLLFLVGLELPIAELKKIGRAALVTGVGQIVITMGLGFGLAYTLGFSVLASVFLGIGLTFGSTIVVVKLLSEKGDLKSLHGKITIGYLLVQDFVAIGLLVVLSVVGETGVDWGRMAAMLVKAVVMIGLAVWLSENVVHKAVDFLAGSTELLFIGSISWCLGVAAIVASSAVGFSVEIGGFLAGLTLASAMEQAQIISRVRPLRDFFLTWFFVALGANIDIGRLTGLGLSTILFSGYVLIVGPLILMAILGWLGYRKRTVFFASLAVAQVSEFSLILLSRAVRTGLVGAEVLSTLTLVAVITMTVSSYFIMHANKIYKKFGFIAGWFERKQKLPEEREDKLTGHVVMFGHNRVGGLIRPVLEKSGQTVLVVDFNPAVVEKLEEEGIRVVYGDMTDHELYDILNLSQASAVVSTVPDVRDEMQMLAELRRMHNRRKQLVILTAGEAGEARKLYKAGANYVLVPHAIGGEFLAQMLEQQIHDPGYIDRYGARQRQKLGVA